MTTQADFDKAVTLFQQETVIEAKSAALLLRIKYEIEEEKESQKVNAALEQHRALIDSLF